MSSLAIVIFLQHFSFFLETLFLLESVASPPLLSLQELSASSM